MSDQEYIAQLETRTERQRLLLDAALGILEDFDFDLGTVAASAGLTMETTED